MRHSACRSILLTLCLAVSSGGALAQAWPAKPVRWIVPFPAGGSADIASRTISARLSQMLGQSVVVENRAGAGGAIGLDFVVKSPPDGYTVVVGTPGPFTVNVHLIKLPFDPLKDLLPVARIAIAPMAIAVNAGLPMNSIADLISYAKANPGKVSFGTTGAGSLQHLAGEQFASMAGIALTHVPYKGSAPAAIDLASGVLPMAVSDLTAILPHHRSGKVRILGVTGAQRTISAPELPTVADQGFAGYSAAGWFGLFAPVGTPAPVIAKLGGEVVAALQLPDVREKILAAGVEPNPGNAADLDRDTRADNAKWGRVIRQIGLKQE